MRRVFIGHRGVGKSSLLERHYRYFPDVQHYDLDIEIESFTQKKISDIFIYQGESRFRDYEVEVFNELIQNESFVISVGGGFNPQNIPLDIEVIYVSRRTDSDGRIFVLRPKINTELTDLEDSLKLYNQRNEKFLQRADFVYHMSEGLSLSDKVEQTIFSSESFNLNAYCTWVKQSLFEKKYSQIELRTDIFSNDEIQKIVENESRKKIMISYRSAVPKMNLQSENIIFDWALELGPPSADFDIISIHEGEVFGGIDQLNNYPRAHLKLCPVVDTWDELIAGHRWQQADRKQRSFLPRTRSGKSNWRWYRILAMQFQKINFSQSFVENDDQPSLYELLNFIDLKSFGAVLGNPIHHSRSAIEQNVLAIPITEVEFSQAMEFLTKLGLRYAAVTSPLKSIAGKLCQSTVEHNSLAYKDSHWIGISTDHFGFKKLSDQIPDEFKKDIVVWGGSGVLSALEKEIPNLNCYSARTGNVKFGHAVVNPKVIIWAAPRSAEIKFPWEISLTWSPQIILDLNYSENSMGLECAKYYQCGHISGLDMFLEQAKYQRKFWKDRL